MVAERWGRGEHVEWFFLLLLGRMDSRKTYICDVTANQINPVHCINPARLKLKYKIQFYSISEFAKLQWNINIESPNTTIDNNTATINWNGTVGGHFIVLPFNSNDDHNSVFMFLFSSAAFDLAHFQWSIVCTVSICIWYAVVDHLRHVCHPSRRSFICETSIAYMKAYAGALTQSPYHNS